MVDQHITGKQAALLRAVAAKDGHRSDSAVLEWLEYGCNAGYFEKVEQVTVTALDTALKDLRRRKVID